MEGDIFYEVHVRGDIDRSNSFLDQVSDFVNDQTDHVGFQVNGYQKQEQLCMWCEMPLPFGRQEVKVHLSVFP